MANVVRDNVFPIHLNYSTEIHPDSWSILRGYAWMNKFKDWRAYSHIGGVQVWIYPHIGDLCADSLVRGQIITISMERWQWLRVILQIRLNRKSVPKDLYAPVKSLKLYGYLSHTIIFSSSPHSGFWYRKIPVDITYSSAGLNIAMHYVYNDKEQKGRVESRPRTRVVYITLLIALGWWFLF
jgi:hypothetical protein